MSSSGSIVSIHKLTAREELLFLRGEGWGEVAEDPLLDFSEISEKVVPYLKTIKIMSALIQLYLE